MQLYSCPWAPSLTYSLRYHLISAVVSNVIIPTRVCSSPMFLSSTNFNMNSFMICQLSHVDLTGSKVGLLSQMLPDRSHKNTKSIWQSTTSDNIYIIIRTVSSTIRAKNKCIQSDNNRWQSTRGLWNNVLKKACLTSIQMRVTHANGNVST